ncbi:MAG: hypothetical protein ACLTUL_11930 [Blautia faecis]
MNVKTNKTKKQANVENQAVNLLSKEELCKRIEDVEKELKSYTWRELETNGKFAKNDKLSFIKDDMLIVGCDIGSETHYIRAIDIRGRELSRKKTMIRKNVKGHQTAKSCISRKSSIKSKNSEYFQNSVESVIIRIGDWTGFWNRNSVNDEV